MNKTEKVSELMRLLSVEAQFDESMQRAADDLAVNLAVHEREQRVVREEFLAMVSESRQLWLDVHKAELTNFLTEGELDALLIICDSPAFRRFTEFEQKGNERIQYMFDEIVRNVQRIIVSKHRKFPRRRIGFQS